VETRCIKSGGKGNECGGLLYLEAVILYIARIEDQKAGLNDPIWGGARYILGSLGLSAIAPLPLTDYKHEWHNGSYEVDSHGSSQGEG
jgi:hypothetical protein